MFLRQVNDPHLAQYAYVIGCQKTGEAIVIDPLRDVEQYRRIAEAEGLRISAVAETHIHADFVSGARELSAAGCDVFVSAEGGPDWQSEWTGGLSAIHRLKNGDTFRIGNIRFDVLHTPGHTPEHVSYLVTDEGGGANEPVALLSGDFLFVGDVGRPDLLEQAAGITGTQEQGAAQLYRSLRQLASLPDHLQVLPAHGAGSACGKSLGAIPSSTLGYERKFNHALKLALHGTEAEFVTFILEGQPEPPLYFANMKRVNKTGPILLAETSQPSRIAVEDVAEILRQPGSVFLDSRSDKAAFLGNHLDGSLFAPAKGDFSGFAGSCLQPEQKVNVVVNVPATTDDLVTQLHRIGFDRVTGLIPASDLAEIDPSLLSSTDSIRFADVPDLLKARPDAVILDVRRSGEHAKSRLRGAINIPHTRLLARTAELPADVPLVVHCQSGMRAIHASALLARLGREVTCVNDSFDRAPAELLDA